MFRSQGNRLLRQFAPTATILLTGTAAVAVKNSELECQPSNSHDSNVDSADNGSTGSASKPSFLAKRIFVPHTRYEEKIMERSILNRSRVVDLADTNAAASLIRPTFEATCRVIRLLSTFIYLTLEYEIFPHLPHYFLQQEEGNDYDEETLQQRTHWEQEVRNYRMHLQLAQKEYTNSSYTEKSLQERKLKVHEAARLLGEAEANLLQLGGRNKTHARAAKKLLQLCRSNGGVYIKVGQHLANLDYLIPFEYIETLQELFNNAPVSSYQSVCQVLKEELGKSPEDLFDNFSVNPIASASLAQVHVAYDKISGKKLAIKIQHQGLRETSRGDLFAVFCAARAADFFFRDFSLGWMVDEILPQLPKELNFILEGKNAERASTELISYDDVVIPKVIWDKTTPRVLCMEFEEGFKCTDIDAIEQAGLQKSDVSKLISSVLHSQVFLWGFVNADPHEANVLLRKHPKKSGKPQLVLVDHGLYKEIDNDFRMLYARLYKSLLMADVPKIKSTCEKLGVSKMYTLLSAMLTSRPFDEIIERNKNGGALHTNQRKLGGDDKGDKAMIRGYAQTYFGDIIAMLDVVPRQMLLLFKMNDCLRHIDYALGTPPSNSLICAGRVAALAVLKDDMKHTSGYLKIFSIAEYIHLLIRIRTLELFQWCSRLFHYS